MEWEWGGDCGGMSQSPIELPERRLLEKRVEGELDFHYYNPTTPPAQLINNGNFLEIKFTKDVGYVTWRDKKYHLKRIEFHSIEWGRGHSVEFYPAKLGLETHDMEMEMIHMASGGEMIALSVLCDRLRHGSVPWFESLVEDFTRLYRLEQNLSFTNIDMKFPPNMFEFTNEWNFDTPSWTMFWDYEGSLTSPPCTEGVHRFINGCECLLSPDFGKVLDKFQTMKGNARSLQPIRVGIRKFITILPFGSLPRLMRVY